MFLKNDEKAKKLKEVYSLIILSHTPKSIRDHSGVISYFGNRAYETVFRDQSLTNLSESGASIYFEKGDDGYVTIKLFPAEAANYGQKEDFVILEKKLDPKSLMKKGTLKKYWKFFIAYMEVTSLDGSPSVIHLLTVNYLRYFKPLIIEKKYHRKKFTKHFLDITRFSLTVGLSGFLLFILTYFFNNKQKNEVKLFRNDVNLRLDSTIERLNKIEDNQDHTVFKVEHRLKQSWDSINTLLHKSLKNDTIVSKQLEVVIKRTSKKSN